MTYREMYLAGFHASREWKKCILPKELWNDVYGAVAWRAGWMDAYDSPLGSLPDAEKAGYPLEAI